MNHQIHDDQLDHDIRDFLAWDAQDVTDAPTATEMAMRISSRPATRMTWPRLAPGLAWVLLAGLLILAIAGVAVIGARLLSDDTVPIGRSYEAVFLRFDEPTAARAGVLVIGVDAQGRERLIAHLPEAGYNAGYDKPIGVVSRSGLLALPASSNAANFHWEIVDLAAPAAEPVVVAGIEQFRESLFPPHEGFVAMGPVWGPGERLAIPWSEQVSRSEAIRHLSFVDPRTGVSRATEVPDGMSVVSQWASDGSGIAVESDRTGIAGGRTVLLPDGTLANQDSGVVDGGYGRRYRWDGTEVRIARQRIFAVSTEAATDELLSGSEGEIVDVGWTADGAGVWIVLQSAADARDVIVQRMLPSSRPETVSTIEYPTGGLPATSSQGHLMGLSPDDSMIYLTVDRWEQGGGEFGYATRLIAPATGASFDIEGAFAGWLAPDR